MIGGGEQNCCYPAGVIGVRRAAIPFAFLLSDLLLSPPSPRYPTSHTYTTPTLAHLHLRNIFPKGH